MLKPWQVIQRRRASRSSSLSPCGTLDLFRTSIRRPSTSAWARRTRHSACSTTPTCSASTALSISRSSPWPTRSAPTLASRSCSTRSDFVSCLREDSPHSRGALREGVLPVRVFELLLLDRKLCSNPPSGTTLAHLLLRLLQSLSHPPSAPQT